jgi:hypothetical protein
MDTTAVEPIMAILSTVLMAVAGIGAILYTALWLGYEWFEAGWTSSPTRSGWTAARRSSASGSAPSRSRRPRPGHQSPEHDPA